MSNSEQYVVGIDLGGTNVRAAVTDLDGHILGECRAPSFAMEGAQKTIGQIIHVIKGACEEGKIPLEKLAGAGIGVPGQHSSDEGIVLWNPNFSKDWEGLQLLKPIRDVIGAPIFMVNDADIAALGEYQFGAGRGSHIMVMLTLGTGIGGGIVVDGEIWLGANEGGGEIGHQVVEASSERRCGCGSFGCLEAMAQRDAIVDYANKELQKGRKSILLDMVEDRKFLTPAIIAAAAAKGDQVSLDVWQKVGSYVGVGVSNLINIINPDCVVIGGRISEAGEPLWGPIRETVRNRAVEFSLKVVRIMPSTLGDNAGIMGGVALAIQKLGLK